MTDNFEYVRDSLINDIETLKSKDGFLYAGFPRFMELFGRDSLISSMELSYLYPQILKNTDCQQIIKFRPAWKSE